MKKKIISCLIVFVAIMLSYFYAHIDSNSYIYNRSADAGDFYGTGILLKNEKITQTFIADEEAIDGINLKVSVVGNVNNVVLHYALTDEKGQVVSEAMTFGNELENNKFNRLDFERVLKTKGKQYTLVLSEENSDEQNGIMFYVDTSSKSEQRLVMEENGIEGTLVTRLICHRFDLETFGVLLGMLAFIVTFMKVLYKFFK